MINQYGELDAFKRDIDLRQFAESLGYQIDRRESWRGSAVLRCAADKIVVKRNGNGLNLPPRLRQTVKTQFAVR